MVLAFGDQAIIKFGDGGAGVRVSISTIANCHQGVRFFNPGGKNPARAVVFKTAPHQMRAIGQQSRRQCVASKTRQALAIEREVQRRFALNLPTF